MSTLDLSSTFVTFFAVVGPPKVLLAYAELTRTRSVSEMRKLVVLSSLLAALVGVLMAFCADALTNFFHISDESLQLAGGVIFFLYAVGLVLGLHLGGASDDDDETLNNPMADGVRELLLPYVASPLAMTAVLVESLTKEDWGWRFTVAGAYLAVVAINTVCVLALAPLLRLTHRTSLEVLSRLLGLLLAAVGVELFLNGLQGLGVHLPTSGGH
ncbi:MarC family protein [Kitasatospora sp. GAS204B]|uniref:MarC family protein n=1 Tax=unclassified Kitasatospora TaxID=2633591 RepID=UPI002475DF92|nr:MarC family protein [Kitasatospora sp. GAS204B]MDH6115717.1 multiple antibiotic resistance protein [Kitasatospora sp. GAS204B]